MTSGNRRWDALDLLRGLSIIGMLLNLNPGAWAHQYDWLEHAKWEGGHLIDTVAPIFLFCVGAVLPTSIARRLDKGASRAAVAGHILWRTFALVAIGVFLNLYPDFDWGHFRIPGVLQRIGLTYGLVGLFLLAVRKRSHLGGVEFPLGAIAGAVVLSLVAYWSLLYFVQVPGYGAPRFDPVGSWPSVVDRAVIGRDHMFKFWPVDGVVQFDPEGIISTWPAASEVLLGALFGLLHKRGLSWPALTALAGGLVLLALGLGLSGVCPVIKNIWTPTFTLATVGFALVVLAGLMAVDGRRWFEPVAWPARIFGSNPLLAYVLSFLLTPLWDLRWLEGHDGKASIREVGQATFERFLSPNAASLLFGLIVLGLLFLANWACWRKRWFLKL
jgi:predicted acyltransferase